MMSRNSQLTLKNVVDLARSGESVTVEFKKSTGAPGLETVTVIFWLPATSGGVNALPDSLLNYIEAHPSQCAQALAEALGTPLRTLERWIKQLRTAGLIEFIGAPKTGGYHAGRIEKP